MPGTLVPPMYSLPHRSGLQTRSEQVPRTTCGHRHPLCHLDTLHRAFHRRLLIHWKRNPRGEKALLTGPMLLLCFLICSQKSYASSQALAVLLMPSPPPGKADFQDRILINSFTIKRTVAARFQPTSKGYLLSNNDQKKTVSSWRTGSISSFSITGISHP